MKLSILIPTKDRPADLGRCIEAILVQTCLPDQIIIVDSSTSDESRTRAQDLLRPLANKFTYLKTESGTNYQRNRGIRYLNSDLVLFLDDDVLLERDYIEVSKEIFIADPDKQIIGTTGKITNQKPLHSISGIFRKLFMLSELSDGRIKLSGMNNSIDPAIDVRMAVDWLSGSNMCWRKEVFDFIRFDENLTGYSYFDDVDFSMRASPRGKMIYIPAAKLVHNVSPVSRLSFRERRRIQVCNHAYLFKKNHPHTIWTWISFGLSLVGLLLQSWLLERSLGAFLGTGQGVYEAIFLGNPRFPKFQRT